MGKNKVDPYNCYSDLRERVVNKLLVSGLFRDKKEIESYAELLMSTYKKINDKIIWIGSVYVAIDIITKDHNMSGYTRYRLTNEIAGILDDIRG